MIDAEARRGSLPIVSWCRMNERPCTRDSGLLSIAATKWRCSVPEASLWHRLRQESSAESSRALAELTNTSNLFCHSSISEGQTGPPADDRKSEDAAEEWMPVGCNLFPSNEFDGESLVSTSFDRSHQKTSSLRKIEKSLRITVLHLFHIRISR